MVDSHISSNFSKGVIFAKFTADTLLSAFFGVVIGFDSGSDNLV